MGAQTSGIRSFRAHAGAGGAERAGRSGEEDEVVAADAFVGHVSGEVGGALAHDPSLIHI